MEQYYLPKRLDFKNLRLCLANYPLDSLYIRDCGGWNPDGSYRAQGLTKIDENLEGKSLNFKKNKSGLHLLIDDINMFNFPLKDYDKGFSLAYERIEPTEDGIGRMVYLSTGIDPYDQNLPEPNRSFLRNIFDNHLIEIYFKKRVHLKFHSWWEKPHWKYFTVVKPENSLKQD
ncbi:MAG: hypothetical protein AABW48_02115 [Nanoarchaeota archaeon]